MDDGRFGVSDIDKFADGQRLVIVFLHLQKIRKVIAESTVHMVISEQGSKFT